MSSVEVFCDGSGNTFASDGGWGYRILIDSRVSYEGSGYIASATNNVAELQAAISGLEKCRQLLATGSLADAKIILVSDSQLVLGYASGRYQCKAMHLLPLYLELRKLYKELSAETRWVKGHSGDVNNEAVDKLAKAAREGKGSGIGGQ